MTDTESIIEGTWGSGEPPREFIDVQVMREMHWSWTDLQATPPDVQQYVWDVILRERAVADAQAKRAARARERKAGTTVVEH